MEEIQKQFREFLQKLGQKISEKRIQLNMSQAELAEKADISVTYISKIECGHKNVSVYLLAKIMNALNLEYIESIRSAYAGEPLYEAMVDISEDLSEKQKEELAKILHGIKRLITRNS